MHVWPLQLEPSLDALKGKRDQHVILSPYLPVFLDGGELQLWMLALLFHHSVQVWLHSYAVPLVQEVKSSECVLQRGNTKQDEKRVKMSDGSY